MTEVPALDFAFHIFCKAPVRPYPIMYVNYIINKKSREDEDISPAKDGLQADLHKKQAK